jgi:hypothetical protein
MAEQDLDLGTRIENFPEEAVGRALLQIVPGGASVDAFVTALAAKLGRRRFDRFVLDVFSEIQELDDRKLDREFLRTEEGFDFFVQVIEEVVRTHDEEKLAALRHAFINGASVGGSRGPTKEIMVRLVGDLTGEHVQVLGAIQAGQQSFRPGLEEEEGEKPEPYAPIRLVQEQLADLAPSDLQNVLADLFRQQLVVSWWTGKIGGTGSRIPRTDRLMLSPMGEAFAQFIRDPRSQA